MKDLGDFLAWTPDPGTYTCRTCGALVAYELVYVHAQFHQRADLPSEPTESGPDSAAPGPEPPGP